MDRWWTKLWTRALVIVPLVASAWWATSYGAVDPTSSADGAPLRAPVVDVVGDSLIRQAAPILRERLDAWGFPEHTVTGHPSRALASAEVEAALGEVEAHPGAVVVVATSSNEAMAHAEVSDRLGSPAADAEAAATIDRLLRRFTDRCVVLVTAKEDVSPLYRPHHAAAYNAVLRAMAAGRNGVVVVDWAIEASTLVEAAFAADRLHFGPDPTTAASTGAGADAYADAIAGGVVRCRASQGVR